MNATNKTLSIVAFYLSKFNGDALRALGYKTYTDAFRCLSLVFGNTNNYMKLRRDEFDALPDSHSPRLGWRNRPPTKDVIEIAEYLKKMTFAELSALVLSLVANAETPYLLETKGTKLPIVPLADAETIMNQTDDTAGICIKTVEKKIRIYNVEIIRQMKVLYSNHCQICGCSCGEAYDSHISEAHNIEYFSTSLNNDSDNLLIVCPNHHRIIHNLNPLFDHNDNTYHYQNGFVEGLKLNYHL